MAINKLLRIEDYNIEALIPLVRESMEGYITPGKRIAGMRIFYSDPTYQRPKHDIIFYWRALYVQCIDEYDFVMKAFGDWSVYKKFTKSSGVYLKQFQPQWEEERELRIRSEAISNVVKSIGEGNVNDSKWLEKHLTQFTTKEDKSKAKDKLDKVINTVSDDVMDTIENNYKNLN